MEISLSALTDCDAASACCELLRVEAGNSFKTRAHWSVAFSKLPALSPTEFDSAKSQTIGIACRPKTPRMLSRDESQPQVEELRSVILSTVKAKYTPTASA